MSGSITLTGLAANDPVPGAYLEINFAQGAASLGTSKYAALIIANKTTAGSATADTVVYGPDTTVPCVTEADAIALFGTGSPAHRMWRRFVKKNKSTPLYVICPAESGGTAATGSFTLTNTASGAGVLRVWVGDEYAETSIANNDSIGTVGANIVLAINAKTWWPVTASYSTGVVTLTWRTKGPQGNWGRYQCSITNGITMTTSATSPTYMSGGGTSDSYTNVLATLLPYRYYYLICEQSPASGIAGNTTAVLAQVNSQSLPTTGICQRVFCGSSDTLAYTTTFATSSNQNAARAEVIWSQTTDRPPEEMAADLAAIYALGEIGTNFRCNFSGYGTDAATSLTWDHPAPRSGTAPTRAQVLSALNNGITPIACNANGSTYLVKRITTRSWSGTSSLNDYRIRDAHKVTVLDKLADDIKAKVALQFSGKKIGDDPAQGARVPGADVVTPRVFKAAVAKVLRDYADNDLLENVETTIANMIVQRETSPTTRLSARIPVDVIDIADQFASAVDQVG